MAIGQCRSAISFDDVAQKTTLARSAHQNNSERTSKPLEEQCDEFVPLVSLRFQGVKTIDVIERNRPPKNSVALEPGDLEVDFVRFFPILLRAIFSFFRGGAATGTSKKSVALEAGDLEVDFVCVCPTLLRTIFPFFRGGAATSVRAQHLFEPQAGSRWPQDGTR